MSAYTGATDAECPSPTSTAAAAAAATSAAAAAPCRTKATHAWTQFQLPPGKNIT